MKNITIRFVKHKGTYMIQRRRFFSWFYIRETLESNAGHASFLYNSEDKKELLKKVLDEYFKVDKKFISITEMPTIKIHQ